MAHFEDHYWWFVGRRYLLAALLDRHLPPQADRRILDVGCGSGGVLGLLQRYGQAVGLDPYRTPLRLAADRGFRHLVRGDGVSLPFADGAFDLVTSLDVIEHIADDHAAATEIARVLRPGGHFFCAVPAYQFLWSQHDEALSHHRRYTARGLRGVLEVAGLEVFRLTYAISFLLPVVLALRGSERLLPRRGAAPQSGLMELPGPLNRLCLATLELEARLVPFVNFPAGVSVLALARKPAAPASEHLP